MREDRYGPTPPYTGEAKFSKRGFLFGLGSALFIVGVWVSLPLIVDLWRGGVDSFSIGKNWERLLAVGIALISFALTFANILAVERNREQWSERPSASLSDVGKPAPPNGSLPEAVASWLVGFVVVGLIIAILFFQLLTGL